MKSQGAKQNPLTAEEVAEDFLTECECGETTWSDNYRNKLKKMFSRDITAFAESYAEERVKETLEEVATIIESFHGGDIDKADAIKAIRAH